MSQSEQFFGLNAPSTSSKWHPVYETLPNRTIRQDSKTATREFEVNSGSDGIMPHTVQRCIECKAQLSKAFWLGTTFFSPKKKNRRALTCVPCSEAESVGVLGTTWVCTAPDLSASVNMHTTICSSQSRILLFQIFTTALASLVIHANILS